MPLPDLATATMILAGGAALGFEAYRQFANRATIDQNDSYSILRGVDLQQLSSRPVYLRGFIFYVACYLAIYVLALSLWEIGDIIVGGTRSRDESGGQGGLPFLAAGKPVVDQEGYVRPLIIATTLISLLSAGVLAPFERAVRNFAHRLAGIPNSVFRIITRLNGVNYAEVAGGESLPRHGAFERALAARTGEPLDEQAVTQTLGDLQMIDLLAPSVVGPQRDRVWKQENIQDLERLTRTLRASLEALQERVKAPLASRDDLSDLRDMVDEAKKSTQALFAVLFTKNRGAGVPNVHPPTTAIVNALRERRRDYLMDSVGGALLLCFFIVVPLLVFVAETSFQRHDGEGFLQALADNQAFIIERIVRFDISSSVILLVAAFSALAVRRNLLETDRWDEWTLKRIPYLRLLKCTVWPALLCVAASLVALLLIDAGVVFLNTGALISSELLAKSFEVQGSYALTTFLYANVVGLAVLFVADLHKALHTHKTILLAVSFAVPYLIWAFISISMVSGVPGPSFVAKESLMLFLHALIFLAGFALLVERGEE